MGVPLGLNDSTSVAHNVFDGRRSLLETHFYCAHGLQTQETYHRVPKTIRDRITPIDAKLFVATIVAKRLTINNDETK